MDLLKGKGSESTYRKEISVAVTNEEAMEEFQKEVIKASKNVRYDKNFYTNQMDDYRA